jgi:colanic acid/amylovoran biosynthesis glycosyltransferase
VLIAGDGPQRGTLGELIDELDAPVELLGPRSHAQIRELYEQASALAMPCVVAADGDRDGMPIVVKEALAMELPVVGTREVALPEEVTPDSGVLVAPGDADALAEAIGELWSRPATERAAMGRAGRAFAEAELDLPTQAEKLLALFEAS